MNETKLQEDIIKLYQAVIDLTERVAALEQTPKSPVMPPPGLIDADGTVSPGYMNDKGGTD